MQMAEKGKGDQISLKLIDYKNNKKQEEEREEQPKYNQTNLSRFIYVIYQ